MSCTFHFNTTLIIITLSRNIYNLNILDLDHGFSFSFSFALYNHQNNYFSRYHVCFVVSAIVLLLLIFRFMQNRVEHKSSIVGQF